MDLTDKTLVCRDCGKEFVFTVGEQEFFESRGLMNQPRRCPACRAAARSQRQGASPSTRPVFKTVCAQCGAETTVPFQPGKERPVYCRECYAKMKSY